MRRRSAQEQFEQLFAAGLEYSKAFNLALGTHLSAEQMAALTRNIVLMESRDVAGQTLLGPLASINVSNNAVINTDRDFILQGASVNVGKDLQVKTGGDWILNTVERSDQISADYGYGHATSEHIRHLSSEVNVGGALAAKVDNLTAVGANINAGTLDVQAQNIN
ncbi:TPA: hypothetical protein PXJ46_002895, partial [Yersinia enterocolitica]|nr:hypothetical protein [Yersinia enterocolitica]